MPNVSSSDLERLITAVIERAEISENNSDLLGYLRKGVGVLIMQRLNDPKNSVSEEEIIGEGGVFVNGILKAATNSTRRQYRKGPPRTTPAHKISRA